MLLPKALEKSAMHVLARYCSFVVLTAACAGAAFADTPPDRRAVTVNGRGEILATPDRARLAMSVEVIRPDVRSAQTEVNRIVRDYLANARALGAKDEDISTAGLSIRAEYDYSGKNGRKFLGYHVTRGLQVVVRDLDKIGDFLLRATDAGINTVSDPQLESSKAEDYQRQALAKAAVDARAKAQVLADTLNVKLGAVHTLNANSDYEQPQPPRPMVMMKMAAAPEADGNSQMGFSAGQLQYSATVSAEFDLLAP
ncbi:MAG: hypothetical protein JWR16_736 [Nevskia sp.]|nr:hypothetical protein [Nevskia sp.]